MTRSMIRMALVMLVATAANAAPKTKGPATRFRDPSVVQPAVDKIRSLFKDIRMWGTGRWEGKDGSKETLRRLHFDPTGKPEADRVTLSAGYWWGHSDSLTSEYLTLVAGPTPQLQSTGEIEAVPFEPGQLAREGVLPEASITVKEDSVRIRMVDDRGQTRTCVLVRTDTGLKWTETTSDGRIVIELTRE